MRKENILELDVEKFYLTRNEQEWFIYKGVFFYVRESCASLVKCVEKKGYVDLTKDLFFIGVEAEEIIDYARGDYTEHSLNVLKEAYVRILEYVFELVDKYGPLLYRNGGSDLVERIRRIES